MKKNCFLLLLFFISLQSNAQIEVAKLVGKESEDYKIGFGAALKLGYPVSEASDINIDAAFLAFFLKDGSGDGLAMFPLKLGYRYTFNGAGSGLYIQPQAGYNLYGVKLDEKFNGLIWAVGTGYLFGERGSPQYDLGLRYESVHYTGGPTSFIALRFTRNFSLGGRE